jgi:RsiW-degrading membrane proteinase PrsW (M82 family)
MTHYLLIAAVAILPVFLLWIHIWRRDARPEPLGQLLKATWWGVLIAIPAVLVETVIEIILFGNGGEGSGWMDNVVSAFCVAAIPEETLKLTALWLVVRKNPYFDEHFDGIVYAVYVSLGFAAIENISYLYTYYDSFLQTGILRALLAVPGHYAFGILMGFFYSLYYFVNRSQRNKMFILVAPVLAHGIYDTLAFFGEVSPTLGGIGFIGIVFFCVKLHKFCYKRIQSHIHRDRKFFGV